MKKLITYFWNPDKKTVQGFNYGTYIIIAPALLLNFVIPGPLVIGALVVFFTLKMVVSLRSAKTHDIDSEKIEKYSGGNSVAKRATLLFYIAICIFSSAIIVFFLTTGGVLGHLLSIIIATISLPGFIEELVIIKRCQSEFN